MARAWGGLAAAAVAAAAAAACSGSDPEPVAGGRIARVPPEPVPEMGELVPAPGTDPAPFTGLARSANVSVDARLLVITADGTNAALDAITSTLDYLGTPYDVLDATTGPVLTPDRLATGDRGLYYGVVLDTGDLAHASASAFTPDEWMTLASYEARFGVRRAVLYAYPSAAYGLVPKPGFDVSKAPIAAGFTADGKKAFTGANGDTAAIVDEGWAYPATATDSATTPLLVDAAGNIYAAVRRYPDGREAMVLTFSQSSHSLATLALAYGMVSWVTQGIFLGERHVYASPQIDDLFVASALYPGTGQTYRMTGADMQTFADWQRARQANPVLAGFRAAWVFNGYGARVGGGDALTSAAMTLAPKFTWISHTWDHRVLTGMSYASAFDELSQNNQFAIGAGLAPYHIDNLVTPEISGLTNVEAMRAAWDVGVRQLAADTAKPEGRSKTPNSGIRNVAVPDLLEIPRRPTEVYYNVSQPAEWIAEYTAMYPGTYTYEQLVATQSEQLLRYLLRGENCPWMFHQANVRDNGGGHSLLRDVLDAAFDRYLARVSFPIVSPTMEDLAERVRGRMRYDGAGASATLGPGAQVVVRVKNAAAVPVTGLCTPAAESYGGQKISYLALAAGESVTLSLADCNPSYGGGGNAAGTSDGGAAGTSDGGAAGTSDGSAAGASGSGTAGARGSGTAGARGGGAWAGASAGAGGAGSAVSGAGGSAGAGTGSGGASAESPGADAGASDGPVIHMSMGGLSAGVANDAGGGCGCSAAGSGGAGRSLWWVALSLTAIALRISSTRRPRR